MVRIFPKLHGNLPIIRECFEVFPCRILRMISPDVAAVLLFGLDADHAFRAAILLHFARGDHHFASPESIGERHCRSSFRAENVIPESIGTSAKQKLFPNDRRNVDERGRVDPSARPEIKLATPEIPAIENVPCSIFVAGLTQPTRRNEVRVRIALDPSFVCHVEKLIAVGMESRRFSNKECRNRSGIKRANKQNYSRISFVRNSLPRPYPCLDYWGKRIQCSTRTLTSVSTRKKPS